MVKHLLFICLVLSSLLQEVHGQGDFSTPANYGFLCDEAQYLCGSDLDGFTGTLLQTNSPLPQPDPICGNSGSPENTQWISFIADDTDLHLNISFGNCTFVPSDEGLSAGIYMDCNLNTQIGDNFQLDCNTVQASSGNIDLQPDSSVIIPGNIYYLYVDGYAGAACDFTINVISGVCVESAQPDEECVQDCGVTNSFQDYVGCTGQEETYSFDPTSMILDNLVNCNPFEANAELDSIIYVDWEISPATGYTISSTPSYYDSLDITAQLIVNWTTPGVYTIKPILSINPLYETCRTMCECTDDVVFTVTIEETILDTLPLIELCPNSTAPFNFCGETFLSDTIVSCYDRDLCTTTVREIFVKERVDLPIDTIYICPNDCFDFNGNEFCNPQLINGSTNGCDTFFQIQLVNLTIDLDFSLVETMIDCDNTEARMTADVVTAPASYDGDIKIFWLNETGDTVSFAESHVTTEGGTYTFYAVPQDASGCFDTLTNTVIKDDQLPDVTFDPLMLDCNNPTDNIILNTSDVITTIAWTGPNGYISSDLSPEVTEGGTYTAVITIDNGCSITDSTEVVADFLAPDLEVMHDDFDCSENIPLAQYMSNSTISFTEWTSAAGTSNDQILTLTASGNYTLTVTAGNGCTATESFVVVDNSYDPSLDLMEDFIWRCNDTVRTIDASPQMDPNLNYQWTTIDGDLASLDEILNINSPGIFILTGTDDSLGCVGKDTVTVLEDPNPFSDIDFVVNNPLCFAGTDGSIEVTSFVGGEGPFTYLYNGTEYDNIEEVMFPTGMQTISIFDIHQCEVSKTFEIVSSEEFEIIIDPVVTVKYGENGSLSASVNIADSLLNSITWYDIDGNFLAEGKDVTIESTHQTIFITAEDINGCIAEASVMLEIDYNIEIFYPNVFSPNQDGVNDYFGLYSNGLPQSLDLLQIYDRAGELIYDETNQGFNETQSGWDGKFNGQLVQPGVYVFIIQYTLANGVKRSKSGSITVVR